MPRGGERRSLCDQKRVNKSLDQLQGQKGSIPGKQANMARKRLALRIKDYVNSRPNFKALQRAQWTRGQRVILYVGKARFLG